MRAAMCLITCQSAENRACQCEYGVVTQLTPWTWSVTPPLLSVASYQVDTNTVCSPDIDLLNSPRERNSRGSTLQQETEIEDLLLACSFFFLLQIRIQNIYLVKVQSSKDYIPYFPYWNALNHFFLVEPSSIICHCLKIISQKETP